MTAQPEDVRAERTVRVHRFQAGRPVSITDDHVATEEPLEIRVRGQAISVTMRTPSGDDQDAELAAGFLVGEGIVTQPTDILRIDPCVRAADGNIINVFLAADVPFDQESLTRNFYASSSCGLCGKASIESVHQHFQAITSDSICVSSTALNSLATTMQDAQKTFEQTGGLHAAALFDREGHLYVLREDVGRHNAVDKALRRNIWPLGETILLVSGRASFEIMQKALAARIPIVCAISAPSSLAVELANTSGMTLVGFLREQRFNVYAGAERIAQ